MDHWAIVSDIENIYWALTEHRRQSGEQNDDRCIADDDLLYFRVLPWKKHKPILMQSWDQMRPRCEAYCKNRFGFMHQEDRVRLAHRKRIDLHALTTPQLFCLRTRLIAMVALHELLGELKTYEHDILLYQEIPDGFVPDIEFARAEIRMPNCKTFCTKNKGRDIRFMDTWTPSST